MIIDTPEKALSFFEESKDYMQILGWAPKTALLPGGLCNHVFRISSGIQGETAIFKYYPPFVANNHSVKFDPKRIESELAGLQLASNITTTKIRVPKVYIHDLINHVIIMEDFGAATSLMDLLKIGSLFGQDQIKDLCRQTRIFMSELHLMDIGGKESMLESKETWKLLL
jgi:5-methylthioribose kinase